jgi:hypothetical protein
VTHVPSRMQLAKSKHYTHYNSKYYDDSKHYNTYNNSNHGRRRQSLATLSVASTVERYSMGTYICPYGKKMCTIMVDGDKEHNVRLTSIQKAPTGSTNSNSNRTDMVNRNRTDMDIPAGYRGKQFTATG